VIRTVAIYGVGLIGGSFALAVREAGFERTILGVSSPATIETAVRLGVIDEGAGFEEAAARADLIYLSQPIGEIVRALERIDEFVRPGTLITDAGSTKSKIVGTARRYVRRGLFLGGHPMAGKETTGVAEAEAGLFRNRPYVLTPIEDQDLSRENVLQLTDWIGAIGARQVVLQPDEHDRLVAYVSHLPQLISTALGSLLGEAEGAEAIAGPAAIEMTRLAMSPYRIWHDILSTNTTQIEAVLEQFICKLQDLRGNLLGEEISDEFAKAAAAAQSLRSDRAPKSFP
jgi:prephenate dehydrogenase